MSEHDTIAAAEAEIEREKEQSGHQATGKQILFLQLKRATFNYRLDLKVQAAAKIANDATMTTT